MTVGTGPKRTALDRARSLCGRCIGTVVQQSSNVHGEGRAPLLRASLSNVGLGACAIRRKKGFHGLGPDLVSRDILEG